MLSILLLIISVISRCLILGLDQVLNRYRQIEYCLKEARNEHFAK